MSWIFAAPTARALALGTLLAGVTPAVAQNVCKPILTVRDARLSPMQPPTLERRWSAVVWVDASRCAPNSSGYFELGFSRLKENGFDLDFSEEFVWLEPSVRVTVDFWADEAVEAYWIGKVSPCRCAR